MKILISVSALVIFILIISTGCMANGKLIVLPESNQISDYQSFASVKNCSILYKGGDFSVIEVHCNNQTKKDGIYIIEPSGIKYFNWYAPQFNSWSWSEKCRSKKDCYYIVNLNISGDIDTVEFYYYINMSEGFYRLKVNKSNFEILKHHNNDIP